MVTQRSFFKVHNKILYLCVLISSITVLVVEYFGRMLSSNENVNVKILAK
ncbi:hypothetical protein VIAQ111709_09215 [Vibrio aquimaris]|uniref:Uncharacterized protein n=1 Tax=Vibrio aquimaris TaxID=2587862 RepID=A0A5P9CF58_9VIBR|nr:hypothetical protein FIV01_00510 [Vibrio aquimaris]